MTIMEIIRLAPTGTKHTKGTFADLGFTAKWADTETLELRLQEFKEKHLFWEFCKGEWICHWVQYV